MTIGESLLPESDREMANARKCLERVPEDKFDWKPHPKSPTVRWLAAHVAHLPSWAVMAIGRDSIDVMPPGAPPPRIPEPESRAALLEMFDKNVAEARAALAGASDEHLLKSWTLLRSGKEIFSQPRVGVLRGFVMNHLIHHRAQLCVYFRLNDVPVPALYGPSADEFGM
ncbi:MAG: DinB family protein [Acidobacteria bacterium]|nr:DinB family protein [Acidobacteriota bacterium]